MTIDNNSAPKAGVAPAKRKGSLVLWVLVATLVLMLGVGGYLYLHQQQQMSELVAQFDLDKEELADEYNELSLQYEGYKFNVGNDSLLALMSSEQIKVQRLLEELRTVKATNALRVGELKKELKGLRNVLRHYVGQIDSLNNLNTKLRAENKKVKKQYNAASATVTTLTMEKQQLTERVEMAKLLEATNIDVKVLNSRGRKTRISKAAQLVFDFTVVRNISAELGNKMIYLRVMRPSGDVLTKKDEATFTFEGKEIAYSAKRMVEYAGEDLPVTIYWTVEEFLAAGDYRVYLFADAHLIGESDFTLK